MLQNIRDTTYPVSGLFHAFHNTMRGRQPEAAPAFLRSPNGSGDLKSRYVMSIKFSILTAW
jgi:hypothetical protein